MWVWNPVRSLLLISIAPRTYIKNSRPYTSIEQGWSLRHERYFEEACSAIGANLASKGHRLVVARPDCDTADKFAKQGFEAENTVTKPIYADYTTPIWAQSHLKAVKHADVVIVIGGADGTYTAAQAALLSSKRLITVGSFGGAAESIMMNGSANQRVHSSILIELQRVEPGDKSDWKDRINSLINDALSDFPRILIIHGRSDDRSKLRDILVSDKEHFAELPSPIIMKDRVVAGELIHERFQQLAKEVDGAMAIVTPDDMGIDIVHGDGTPRPAIDVCNLKLCARQNIWVEIGWFWSRLGMERVMLLRRNNVEIPSDLLGMNIHEYTDFPPYSCR